MLKKLSWIVLGLIIVLALIIGSCLAYNFFSGNVHTVIPGKMYRTAQLDHAGLEKYTKKFHIKTMINLRGKWSTNHWYQVESRFAKTHHIHYYPIHFFAYEAPPKNKVRELVHLLLTKPQPILFHCEGGADRAGMAAALSVILFKPHVTFAQIKRQVSWHYNVISDRTVGYQLLRNYFVWLKTNHDTHSSKKLFLEWLALPTKIKTYHGWFLV